MHLTVFTAARRLVRVLALERGDLVLKLEDLIFVVLVCLLDIPLVLVHTFLQLCIVLQVLRFLVLLRFLDVGQHDLHVQRLLLRASLPLVQLLTY